MSIDGDQNTTRLAPIDPSRTALVLVDLQRGIVANPGEPHDSNAVVANAHRLAHALRSQRGLVILVRVDPNLLPQPSADQPSSTGEVTNEWAEIVPEIAGDYDDVVVTKHQWSAFHGTDLDTQLRRRSITTLILGGIATNIGVESTARAAYDHGYEQIFAEDAMTGHAAEAHLSTVSRVLPLIGHVRSTDQIIDALRDPDTAASQEAYREHD